MSRTILRPYKPKPRYIPKTRKHEQSIQRRVCSYIRNHYPNVYFRSDTASGMMLSYNQAAIHHSQQSCPGQPDIMIFSPSRGYHALLLELKNDKVTVYKRNGELTANPHIRAQAKVLADMESLGYCARFARGYDEAIRLIDWYFNKPENTELF